MKRAMSKRAWAVGLGVILGSIALAVTLGSYATGVEPGVLEKPVRLEPGVPRDVAIDLGTTAHQNFQVDAPVGTILVRWKLAAHGSELSLSARRGARVTDDEVDFQIASESGRASITYDRFSEPAAGAGRFFARVAWTFRERPRTAEARLASIPFTITVECVTSEVTAALTPGAPIQGVLGPECGGSRCYRFEIPPDTRAARLDIAESESDVDLFARPHAPFLALDDDVRFAQHLYGRESLVLRGSDGDPLTPGPWFVDVVDAFEEDRPARFTLLLTLDAAPPASLLAFPELPAAIGTGPVARALAAVVEIATGDGAGSGVVVTPSGWILTNAHVVERLGGGFVDEAVVLFTLDPREPARETCRARVERVDEARDMALLRVVTGFLGQPLPRDVRFPSIELASGEPPAIGDPLWLVGYPTTGGRGSRVTISATRGVVSGFDQAKFGPVLKTDAEITSGNSGGAALDSNGRLVGLPTSTVENGSGQIGYVHPVGAVPESWRELWKP